MNRVVDIREKLSLVSEHWSPKVVARLNEDPNRFLAAVQVGVTLAGFLSASFGGATLAGDLAPVLVVGGEKYVDLRQRELDVLTKALTSIRVRRMASDSFDWADRIPEALGG